MDYEIDKECVAMLEKAVKELDTLAVCTNLRIFPSTTVRLCIKNYFSSYF